MATPKTDAVQTACAVAGPNAMIVDVNGYQLNLMSVLIIGLIFMLFYTFYSIQKSRRLDFADMFTKDGQKVSATKVMQFIAGISTTWFIIKTGLQGTLSAEILGIYLAFMASVEGFSKFISAKYNYKETSVKEAQENKADKKAKLAQQDASPVLDAVDGDGPVEAEVTETTTPAGGKIVQQKIKKG